MQRLIDGMPVRDEAPRKVKNADYLKRLRDAWTKRRVEKKLEKAYSKRDESLPMSFCRHVVPPVKQFPPPTDKTPRSAFDSERPGWARKRDRRRELR